MRNYLPRVDWMVGTGLVIVAILSVFYGSAELTSNIASGLIGFLGLLVPHFTRILVGADHRRLLPAAVLFGGIAAVWADILGRVLVRGVDIPLGVMLALMGAPAFIVMLTRRAYRFGGAE